MDHERLEPRFALPTARGRYDRTKSPTERKADHLARLVGATAVVVSARGRHRATVSDIVKEARVGRNTFYACFVDLDDALVRLDEAALEALWQSVSGELASAFTPTEKLRAVARAWMEHLDAQPHYARALLQAHSTSDGWLTSAAGDAIKELLRAALADAHRDAVLTIVPDELRLLAATAILEAFGRRYLDRGGDSSSLEATVVDLIVRVFR